MAWGSTVPGCLTALVESFAAATGVDTLKCRVVGGSSRTEAIVVGYSDNAPAVETSLRDGDAYLTTQLEQYTVHCCIEVIRGGTNATEAVIDRGMAILSALAESLVVDQTIGGTVMAARLARWNLAIEPGPKGSSVSIPFDVDVDAYTTPR